MTNLETLKARDNELEEMTGSIVIQLPGEEKCERIKLQSSLTSRECAPHLPAWACSAVLPNQGSRWVGCAFFLYKLVLHMA